MSWVIRKQHKVIVADNPWKYQNFSKSKNGAAQAEYNGMTYEEIANIPVDEWADDDCILFMWNTWPKLFGDTLDEGCHSIAKAWGFNEYVTGFPWVKTSPTTANIRRGIGFWTMSASEPMLIFRKGKPKREKRTPPIGLAVGEDRVFWCPIGRHSAKPVPIQIWIEEVLKGPYLELFARKKRKGWTCYGNAIGSELGPFGVRKCKPLEFQGFDVEGM